MVYSSSTPLDAQKSSAITLKCHVNGSALDEIQWLKNGESIDSIGSLVIRHPSQNDNGNYKCVARNKAAIVVSKPYNIEIHPNTYNSYHYAVFCEPKITHANPFEKSLLCRYKRNGRLHRKRSATEGGSQSSSSTSKRKKITVAENGSTTINCNVSRLDRKASQVSVKWKKDGKEILNEQNKNPVFRDDGRIIMDKKNGSIRIVSAIPSDNGAYEVCFEFFKKICCFFFGAVYLDLALFGRFSAQYIEMTMAHKLFKSPN